MVGHGTTFPSGPAGAITLIGRYPCMPVVSAADSRPNRAGEAAQEPAATRNPTLPVELSDELPNRADTR